MRNLYLCQHVENISVRLFSRFSLSAFIINNFSSRQRLHNLQNGKFQPYKKPNDDTLHTDKQSNHPPAIMKQIPKSVSRRVSNLLSDHATFTNAASTYNDALKNSGFNTNIEYLPDADPKLRASQRRKRSRNIIWFNPPYSRNVKTNVGRKFLALMDKHFPTANKLQKIFNKNTLKVSYSCMGNMKDIVNKHNVRILNRDKMNNNESYCNCRKKKSCPPPGNCMTSNIIHKAEILQADSTE